MTISMWFGSFKRIAVSVLVLAGMALAQNPNLDTNIKGSRWPAFGVESGSGNTYTFTRVAALAPILRTGSTIEFFATHANTGAATLAVNGGSAIAMKKWVAGALVSLTSGDILNGQGVIALYDGTQYQVALVGGSPANVGSSFSGIRTCFITTGDPDSSSPVLVDGNDAPAQCSNDFGFDLTIKGVACWANAGSPTVNPILTAGGGTSILTGALTCGTASWAAGTVNGSPVLHSFSTGGATCSSTPCTLDANITTAGGTARYLIIKVDFQ